MKKYIILLLLGTALATSLKAQKKDTTVLAVYNNNQRFMLYPMPYGKDRPDKDFVAEMVFSIDTINVLKEETKKDSTGKFPKRWMPERSCNKKPSNVKGKVALMVLNSSCDVSTQVYNAQEAGALAVIIIHATESRDSVILPKKSNNIKYDNDNKVKIPCFTVRNEIGRILMQLSPSLVGITQPKADVPNTQSLVSANNPLLTQSQTATQKPKVDTTGKIALNGVVETSTTYAPDYFFENNEWEISPNPATSEAVINYHFSKTTIFIIDVYNELGQLMKSYNLPNSQTGKLAVDVSKWQSGSYRVRMITNDKRDLKRFVVTH